MASVMQQPGGPASDSLSRLRERVGVRVQQLAERIDEIPPSPATWERVGVRAQQLAERIDKIPPSPATWERVGVRAHG